MNSISCIWLEFRKEKEKQTHNQTQPDPNSTQAQPKLPWKPNSNPALGPICLAQLNPTRAQLPSHTQPTLARPIPPASDAASAPARPHRRLATDKAGPLVGAPLPQTARPVALTSSLGPLARSVFPGRAMAALQQPPAISAGFSPGHTSPRSLGPLISPATLPAPPSLHTEAAENPSAPPALLRHELTTLPHPGRH